MKARFAGMRPLALMVTGLVDPLSRPLLREPPA
jgi:hypothetical protein